MHVNAFAIYTILIFQERIAKSLLTIDLVVPKEARSNWSSIAKPSMDRSAIEAASIVSNEINAEYTGISCL